MKILSIDTSCDETAVAITEGRRVIANVLYSQVLSHKQWGGVVPSIAKRAHEERIGWVIEECCRKAFGSSDEVVGNAMKRIDYIAVTYGPGLAIALEVGIRKAKELAMQYDKKVIPINHMEGHIYSCYVQNSKGNPPRQFEFPSLVLLASGAHTELVLFKDQLTYEVIGQTRDDAAGEAIDKGARMLGFEYPGGPVLERLASEVENRDTFKYPRPMYRSNNLDFSFSGLKTAFLYSTKKMDRDFISKNIKDLASSYQEAIFDLLIKKTSDALETYDVKSVQLGGGVAANRRLRHLMRQLAKKHKVKVFFPSYKYLTGDNAAMIGVAAYFRAQAGKYISASEPLDRVPRLSL